MSDDPRKILSEAGVECAEVEQFYARFGAVWVDESAAILALARLVAKYKWQRDKALSDYCDCVEDEWGISHWPTEQQPPTLDDWLDDEEAAAKWVGERIADLDRRWEERQS